MKWLKTNLSERNSENLCDFKIQINPYQFSNKGFKENSYDVAKELSEKYDNLYLAYSGGLDSEYILKVFTDLKLPIKPIFLGTPFNEIESGWAKFYCREIGNKLKIVNLDANNTINELKKRTFDRSLSSLLGGIPLFLGDYVKEMGGHLLTGHGCLDNKVSPDVVEFTENNYYLSDDNYHPGNFYDYNLALTYSHIKELKTFNVQLGKAKLYDLYYRPQVSWDIERVNLYLTNDYNISEKTTIHLEKNKFLETLEKYEIE